MNVPASLPILIALLSFTALGQICPASIDGYPLEPMPNRGGKYNQIECREGGYGSEYCYTLCSYVLPKPVTTGVRHFRVTATWTTKPYSGLPNLVPGSYGTHYCVSRPEYKLVTNSPRKVVYAEIHDVGPEGSESFVFAKKAADKLLEAVEGRAIACPGAATVQPPENNALKCRRAAQAISKLQAKIREIEDEIEAARDHKRLEESYRDKLSHFTKLIAALNTPNYNGELRETIQKLKNNKEYREKYLVGYGFEHDIEPLTALRSIRDVVAARVEYFQNAPRRITALHDERIFTELELAKARSEMTRNSCGGRFDEAACDISGSWKFRQGNGAEMLWDFQPSEPGKYTARNAVDWILGTAEVFGKEVIIRWKGPNVTGRHKLTLSDFCLAGDGEAFHDGMGSVYTFRAVKDVDRDYERRFIRGVQYLILYNGQKYSVIYEPESHNGVPIDTFYFKIVLPHGVQAEQNGQKLWGKFVRVPSTTYRDQSHVEWWYSDWVRSGDGWARSEKKGVRVEFR